MDWKYELEQRVKQKIEGDIFTSEDIRESMERDRIMLPKEGRHIGPVMVKLKNEGFIEKNGTTTAKRPNVHKGLKNIWVRTNKQT